MSELAKNREKKTGDERSYTAALRLTLRDTAAAYGYTLTIASTITMLSVVRGQPDEGELFMLVGGAVAGFAVLEIAVSAVGRREERPSTAFPFAGALNFASAGGGLGAATGLAHAITTTIAWLFAPMAATAVYLLLVAAQVNVVELIRRN